MSPPRWRGPNSVGFRPIAAIATAGMTFWPRAEALARFLAFNVAEVERTAGHRCERLARELGETRHQPFVDAIAQQQHLDAALAEDLQVRARTRRTERIRGHVVDPLLPLFHARDIIGERD